MTPRKGHEKKEEKKEADCTPGSLPGLRKFAYTSIINEFQNFVYKFWSLHLALSDKTNRMKIGQEMREKKQFFLFLE